MGKGLSKKSADGEKISADGEENVFFLICRKQFKSLPHLHLLSKNDKIVLLKQCPYYDLAGVSLSAFIFLIWMPICSVIMSNTVLATCVRSFL